MQLIWSVQIPVTTCAVLTVKRTHLQIASKIVEAFDSHGLSAAQIARQITDGMDTANAEEQSNAELQSGGESSSMSMPVSGITSQTRELPQH